MNTSSGASNSPTLGEVVSQGHMNKVVGIQVALDKLADNQTLMIGGFAGTGTPEALVDAIIARGIKNLTVIANDTAFVDKGIGKLVVNQLLKKVVVSHIGTNKETGRQMHAGEIQVDLVPQGTLIERIRCGGAGLGGVLTPTGVGTIVEAGKEKFTRDGKVFLLELPLRADVALVKAWKADTWGNLVYRRAARNFNPTIALAADFVIVEAEEIVEAGTLDPDEIMTPGGVVNMIVQG